MSKFKEDLSECKKYSNTLKLIEEALIDARIPILETANNELVINSDKNTVEDIIYSLPIPKCLIPLMISVKESKKRVYIRKKIK